MLIIRLNIQMKFHCNLDVRGKGRSSLAFDDVNQLLGVKDSDRFKSIMSSISCLMTIAVADSTEDASRLIDFVRGLRSEGYRVAKTQLLVLVPILEYGLLQNKSINFNTMIMESGEGTVKSSKLTGKDTFIFNFLFSKYEANCITLPCFG